MNELRFAAIVLAAGLSTRMASFKPLLPLGGTTVVEHALATFRGTGTEVYLVTGHREAEVRAAVQNEGVTIIVNPVFEKGMLSSVQAGLRNLRPGYSAFFLLPADIPLVRPATVTAMIKVDRKHTGLILYPVYGGKRGHPPLVPAALMPEILAWDGDGGLQAVLRRHGDLAHEVAVRDEFILRDVDTPEAYREIAEWARHHPGEKKAE